MGDLAPDLYVALGRLVRSLRQDVPSGALGAGAVSALTTLARCGPVRASALAEAEGLSAAGITRILNRLESDGLIVRSPDPDDGRALMVSLTAGGSRLIGEGNEVKLAALRRRLGTLSDEQRTALAGAVPVLERLAECGGAVSAP